MAITRVQGNSVNSAGLVTSQAITLGVGVTLGNLLVVSVATGNNGITLTGPAGWTQVTINQPNGALATIETSIWYLVVAAGQVGQTSWTWTLSAAHTVYICIEEWHASTSWPANPVDVSANGDTAGTPVQATTILSGTTATTAQAEELWIASLAYKGSAQTESSISSGWTRDLEATLANNNTMTMLYKIASAIGTPACQYTIGTKEYWAGCVVAFKDVAASTTPALSTSPTTLSFSASFGGANPASQNDTLSETSGNATAWTSAIGYPLNYAQTALADNPVSFWRLSEASGTTMIDATGNITGTYSASGITYSQVGPLASDGATALLFDGANGYATAGNVAALNPANALSIVAWINWSQFYSDNAGHFPLGMSNGAADGYFLEQGSSAPYNSMQAWIITTNGTFRAISGTLSTGTWYHVAVTYDGANLNLYITKQGDPFSGIPVATTPATGTITATASPFLLGSTYTTAGAKFNGKLADVAIYSKALSPARIAAEYNASKANWLICSPTSGSLLANGTATITVSPATGSLVPGTYNATVTFTATTGGSQASITVSVGIVPSNWAMPIGGAVAQVRAGTLLIQNTVGRRGHLSATVYDPGTGALYGTGPYGAGSYGVGGTHFQQYQQVAVIPGGSAIPAFTGYITTPQETKPGFAPLLETQVVATDQHYLADKRIVAAVYKNKTCGYIVQDMLTNILSQEGVIVGQIATGPVVPVANFGYVTVASALDALVAAASSSGVPYYWMIDQNKALWFVAYTAVVGPAVDGTQIDDGRASGMLPVVTRANPLYRNTQYAAGGVAQTGTNDETKAGDGQTRSFPFNYPLAATPTTFTLNGNAVNLGIKGQTGYQYYYAIGDPIIAQDSSQTVLVSTDRLRMVYVGQEPTTFAAYNAAQIAAQSLIDGTSGINEAVLTDNTIATSADGLAKCNQQLTQYGSAGQKFEFATRQSGFAQGQLITVTYAPLGFTATQMLIEQLDISDQPDGFNIWYTVHAIAGPYDVNWVSFFSRLLQPATIANSINLGVTLS